MNNTVRQIIINLLKKILYKCNFYLVKLFLSDVYLLVTRQKIVRKL